MPGTAMPMIVAREIKNAWACHIQCYVEIVGQLIEEMTGVGAFISPTAIVGAAHVSTHADALLRPSIPHTIRVKSDRNDRRFLANGRNCEQRQSRTMDQQTHGLIEATV